MRFQEVVEVSEECLTFQLSREDKSNLLANLGIAFSKLKNYERAEHHLIQAREMGLTREWENQVYFELALTYAHLNLLDKSKRDFCEQKSSLPTAVSFPSIRCIAG